MPNTTVLSSMYKYSTWYDIIKAFFISILNNLKCRCELNIHVLFPTTSTKIIGRIQTLYGINIGKFNSDPYKSICGLVALPNQYSSVWVNYYFYINYQKGYVQLLTINQEFMYMFMAIIDKLKMCNEIFDPPGDNIILRLDRLARMSGFGVDNNYNYAQSVVVMRREDESHKLPTTTSHISKKIKHIWSQQDSGVTDRLMEQSHSITSLLQYLLSVLSPCLMTYFKYAFESNRSRIQVVIDHHSLTRMFCRAVYISYKLSNYNRVHCDLISWITIPGNDAGCVDGSARCIKRSGLDRLYVTFDSYQLVING
ncbi:hypothetical protein BC830DRAFT_1086753 [Chytriomyces sp. MP71]|nr:hypothetical protein BC830DRAFT_1086753 [Chytriomyces sp. MP71]